MGRLTDRDGWFFLMRVSSLIHEKHIIDYSKAIHHHMRCRVSSDDSKSFRAVVAVITVDAELGGVRPTRLM